MSSKSDNQDRSVDERSVVYGVCVRWEQLFEDLEGQVRAARTADARADVAELVRAERSAVHLVDRLRAAVGRPVRLELDRADPVDGTVVEAATEWVLVADGAVRRALVPVGGIVGVHGLDPHAAPPPGRVEQRLGLGHALRALARDRATVRVEATGRVWRGRLERVGADHVDLSVGPEVRAATAVTVPFAALRVVATL